MKLTEALQQIFPSTVFPDNDIAATLTASALKDIELPDDVMTKFNSHYMTPDRAANDPEISKKLKAKFWGYLADEVEKKLKGIVSTLSDEWQTKYFAIPEGKVNGIYDRLEVVREGVAHLKEKGSGDDVKTASEKFRKIEKELRDQITAHEKMLKDKESEFESKESGMRMNYALKTKLQDKLVKLDPAIIKTDVQKNFIIDSTINSLQSGFVLEFDKENPALITFLNKDRTGVFEGNTPVTLDKYIEKLLDPYTVKNNGGTPVPSASESKRIVTEKTSGLTLKELQWQKTQSQPV